ncbi:hypothetical protein Tco_0973763 [Tanacetum coccineum]|uniref:Uncharacterized protein n=1 Tax=Tanacetum coccineum TaxID=301880 RepID=A0ABQ5E9R3_9ASTR
MLNEGIKKIDVPSISAASVLTVGHNAKKRKTSHSTGRLGRKRISYDLLVLRESLNHEIAPTGVKEQCCFYCNTKAALKALACLMYLPEGPQVRKVEKGGRSGLVSFALSMVSRHQQNPGEGHWTALNSILRYLRNTKDRFLVSGGEKELRVTGYCDAGWQTDKDDSRSHKVEEGHVIVKDIRSEDNPADPFTKALAKSKHDEHAKSIGLKDKIEF